MLKCLFASLYNLRIRFQRGFMFSIFCVFVMRGSEIHVFQRMSICLKWLFGFACCYETFIAKLRTE